MKAEMEKVVAQMVRSGIRLPTARSQFKKRYIQKVLEMTGGNLHEAAELFGIHPHVLKRKIQNHLTTSLNRKRYSGRGRTQ